MAKYSTKRNGWEVKDKYYKVLAIWREITSTKASFMKNIRYGIGSGEKIQFWLNVTIPLADCFPDLFRFALDKEATVQNYLERQGPGAQVRWGPTFRRSLKEQEESQLVSLLDLLNGIFIPEDGEVVRLWSASKDGSFFVSSFFSEISMGERARNSIAFIWQIKAPPRVVIFGWLAIQKKILTMDNLRRRGKILVNACPMYLVLNRKVAKMVWSSVLRWFSCSWVFPCSIQELFSS